MPTLVDSPAKWDTILSRGISGEFVFTGGTYNVAKPLDLKGVTFTALPNVTATLKYTGPVNKDFAIVTLRDGSAMIGMDFDANGIDATCIRGDDVTISGCTASRVNDFCVIPVGAKNAKVVGNIVPQVARYFLYAAGEKKTVLNSYIVTRFVANLVVEHNTCLECTGGGHIVREYDALGTTIRFNTFGRPNANVGEQMTILKLHTGSNIVVEYNRLFGGRKRYSGVTTVGPLSGGDGGIQEQNPPKRDWMLRTKLMGYRFAHNVCDDVVHHFAPGTHEMEVVNNTFNHTRDVCFDYKPTEGYTEKGTGLKKVADYRPWRGEITGVVKGNLVVPANTKPVHDLPAGVSYSE